MDYPEEAYSPTGELWWKLDKEPGSNRAFGDERKIAAYLACTKRPGETFTTKELRLALGVGQEKNDKEHFQRRIRQLRSKRDGWIIESFQDNQSLEFEHYRIDKIGWHPGIGPRPKNSQAVSARTRALVLERDSSRCVVCGVGAGEPYPENPNERAKLTIGHILPQERGGSNNLGNLRAECALCNEQKRAEGLDPESFEAVWAAARKLSTPKKRRLDEWVSQRRRTRDDLDEVYDRTRKLGPGDYEKFAAALARATGRVID